MIINKVMKCLPVLLFPFSTWACSISPAVDELVAYASIIDPTKVTKEVEAIGVFVPSVVEKAKASSMSINYVNGEKLVLQTSISVNEVGDWELQANPELKGYSISYFYLNMSQVNNIKITVYYRFPKTKDGGMAMCGPMRNYKLSDLMVEKK